MAKFIIVSACRFNGGHHDKGEEIDLDLDRADHSQLAGNLNHAGRIALASPAVRKQISEELAQERSEREKQSAVSAEHLALAGRIAGLDPEDRAKLEKALGLKA